ncbi:MAG: tetratricopeptide (TPR) repeat protein [Aureispira sp.]|jgi:tetratricopeptide (TPR) repeat protein
MKIKYLFPIIAYFICYQTVLCQQSPTDSLENLLSQTINIANKVSLYEALIVVYKEKDADKAIEYSNQVLKLLSSNKYKQRGKIYRYLAAIYKKEGQYEQAFSFSDSALYCFEHAGLKEEITLAKNKKWSTCQNLTVSNYYKDTDKAMKYAKLSLKLAFNSNNLDNIGKSHLALALVYSIKLHAERSFEYFDSAIYYFKQTNNQKELARAYNNMGQTNCRFTKLKEGSKWLYKSLEIYDSLNLPSKKANIFNALAIIDVYFKDYPEAIKKLSKAIDFYKKSDTPEKSFVLILNLGNTYCHLKEWEKAILYLDEVIPLLREFNKYTDLAYAYTLKATALQEIGQLKLAKKSIKKALELKEYSENKIELLGIYMNQAGLFFLTKEYSQSIALFTMVLDSAMQIPHLRLQIGALQGLMDNYTATNNFKKAYESSTKQQVLNDSLIAQNNQQNIKDIEIKYNTEKKEQENKLLLKEQELQTKDIVRNRQLVYLSIGFAFLIFIISILVLKQYKTSATATNNELKSRLLRNQMSPHFLFNSLVAIQSFVYTNNPIKAGDYLSSFATLMRAILDNSSQEYITISKELQWLENYLSLQLLRFKDKFEYQIDLEEHINVDNTLIPPMLIQPFIENAIEHGLKNLDKKGLISIHIRQQGDALSIEVKDNGLGMSENISSEHKKHQSRALLITKERLTFLNKKRTKKIDFDITSSVNNGTAISFQIPFKSKF